MRYIYIYLVDYWSEIIYQITESILDIYEWMLDIIYFPNKSCIRSRNLEISTSWTEIGKNITNIDLIPIAPKF